MLRHHLAGSALSESVRHRYGRSCISAPKPTIPSIINTSSPITIQPCNAVMFSSFELMALAQRGPHRLAQQVILIRRKLARWSGTHRDHRQVGEHDMGNPSLPVGSIPAIKSAEAIAGGLIAAVQFFGRIAVSVHNALNRVITSRTAKNLQLVTKIVIRMRTASR